MKYIGLDYGSKRVGIAISNEEGTIAFPHAVLPNDTRLFGAVLGIVKAEGAQRIVAGDTRSHGGAANPVTEEAEAFFEHLARESGVPLFRAFEVFSSVEAARYAPHAVSHDDSAAAAIILQRFLEGLARRDA